MKHLLLDSHILLWLVEPGTRQLSAQARRIIAGAARPLLILISMTCH